ncbi:MAG: formate dehydrogenase, partial [Acidimicrobiales bacterium]
MMPPVVVFVPLDAAARSVGADEVASALVHEAAVRGREIRLVRNGSRGMFWLEPLVEVTTPEGRVAYGPVDAAGVGELLDAGMLDGAPNRLWLGKTEEISHLRRQTRFTFARVGVNDPLSVADYEATGGLAGLRRALEMSPEQIVAEVTASGLRGRGGAGFPTGIKWQTVLDTPSDLKFIACNADEGDSGTFADRMLMEGDPFLLVEGMVVAGLAVGAAEGYIYVRSEYPDAITTMASAIDIAYLNGWLGPSVLGSGRAFELYLRVGAGAYICGEETAMLESLEGRRGMIRAKQLRAD